MNRPLHLFGPCLKLVLANASERSHMETKTKRNDLTEILTQAFDELKQIHGDKFDIEKVNLAELERMTGITRSRLRTLQKNGFVVKPHGLSGRKAAVTVLTGYTGVIDDLLRRNITNAVVCFERITEQGYTGSLTTVRRYIEEHQELIPPKRQIVSPQGNRGRRYRTSPGEAYQMDWGFVKVTNENGTSYRAALFAMICHHCGKCYIEFFPNAKQENLFIGMLHAFYLMGVPEYVLTDNMKSVVIKRDPDGNPIWQHDYEEFMNVVGFKTKLCKPRHPFTKGKVERLIRFVKDNFLADRIFGTITGLNFDALDWSQKQNGRYHRAVDCVPDDKHHMLCMTKTGELLQTKELAYYLCPERKISFDGFINYEGRRFGVPYWYKKKTCRIRRKEYAITIYSDDLESILTTYDVTWSRYDRYCEDQYVKELPEEYPSMPVKTEMFQIESKPQDPGFEKFNFERGLWNE